jgi:hypothetical protein
MRITMNTLMKSMCTRTVAGIPSAPNALLQSEVAHAAVTPNGSVVH